MDHLVTIGRVSTPEDLEVDRSTCRICGGGPPSDEHIPPKSAFNSSNRVFEKLLWLPTSRGGGGEKVITFQCRGGFRVRSLCERCNNAVCAPYAAAYVSFSRQIAEGGALWTGKGSRRSYLVRYVDLVFVMKEIAAMILSVNSTGMAESYPELRRFIRDPRYRVPFPFQVLLFNVPDHPAAGTITGFHARADVLGIDPDGELSGGEIALFPVGVVYGSKIGDRFRRAGLLDITHWSLLDERAASQPKILSMPTLLTATDTLAGINHGRRRPQVMFTDGS